MFPSNTDTPVQLHAVLNQRACVLTEIGLGRADPQMRLRAVCAHFADRTGGDRPACVQPHGHVGEAVFECLVGGQWPAEAVTIARPRDGHGQNGVQDPNRFGALQHHRGVALAPDQCGRLGERSDHRRPFDVDGVEFRPCIVLDQIDAALTMESDSGGADGNEELPWPILGACGHQQQVCLGAGFDAVFDAIEAKPSGGGRRGELGLMRGKRAAGLVHTPGGHRFTGNQRGDGISVIRVVVGRNQPR